VEKNLLAILEALPRSRSLGRKLNSKERWDRANEMLTRFNLNHVRHTVAARASGGEKRRLEIARCLLCEPMLILLDEPFAAVDPKTTEDIRKNIRELAQQGIGILLTDHNVREVLKITDRSYLIKEGQVITHGTPQQLIHDPIAINEYLGTTFSDNTFGAPVAQVSPTPAPVPVSVPLAPSFSMEQLLEQEQMRRLVDGLKTANSREALAPITLELLGKGVEAVPILLEGLERRDSLLRERICVVLGQIVKEAILFDPHAPEEDCRRQLNYLRERYLYRRAA
jgi:lipopolysaccharide export system ATP-binding protein